MNGKDGGMTKRRVATLLPLALFAGLAIYLGLALQRDPSTLPSALLDKPVPVFALPPPPPLERGLRSEDLRGQPRLVNVFASWCTPCRIEHPTLQSLAQRHGVAIHGLNYKDKPEDAAAFLGALDNPYQGVGMDRDGRIGIEWGVYGVPETFVIDAEGRIRYRHVGPLMERDVEETILPLLARLTAMQGGKEEGR
jgi:cytochrome c biogenesis protein CcmG, thiol:disulfide interchange protein DsbE